VTTYLTTLTRQLQHRGKESPGVELAADTSELGAHSLQRLQKRLLAQVAEASAEFGLLEPNDRVMVAVSGGKDSFGLLYLLREIQKKAPFEFSIVAVNLDQKQPGFPADVLPRYFESEGYEYRIVEEDTYSIVKEKVPEGKTYCSLCSRLRRGVLYNVAQELGATKLALGHHRDDALETLLLNLFYSGQIKAMPPKLRSDDGRNIVIRPLIYCAERDLALFAELRRFPIIPCNLCGSQENLKRQEVKELLHTLEQSNPKLRGNMLAALKNVRLSHLLSRDWDEPQAVGHSPLVVADGYPNDSGSPSNELLPVESLLRR
jgi:tRNA 2-thiocytidine biosynthesis protein TtcA